MEVGMFKAPACRVGAGASKNGGEAANFSEFLEILEHQYVQSAFTS